MSQGQIGEGAAFVKDSIAIAIAEGGRDGEVRFYGRISNDLHGVTSRNQRESPREDGAGNPASYPMRGLSSAGPGAVGTYSWRAFM